MERKSDIGIIDNDTELNVCINGFGIVDVHYGYGDNSLINDKEDAIEVAKLVVDWAEEKFGSVKNEDFPNPYKLPLDQKCIEGYPIPQYATEEEEKKAIGIEEEAIQKMMEEVLDGGLCE